MKKPPSVKWIIGLIISRMVFSALLVLGGAIILFNPSESGFLKGFGDTIIKRFALEDTEPAYAFCQLLASVTIPCIILIFELVFIQSKKKVGFWICIALDIIFTTSSFNLPIAPVILLILGLTRSTQLYFKGESETIVSADILDQDLK